MARINCGYEIINNFVDKSGIEIVLGINEKCPSKYATWECQNGDNYYWGHYFCNYENAKDDFCRRIEDL